MNRRRQWKVMDNLKRKKFIKYEIKKLILISIKKSNKLNKLEREWIDFQLTSISPNVSINKINNRCLISGRNYNVLNKLKLSRFHIRNEGYLQNISGLQKF